MIEFAKYVENGGNDITCTMVFDLPLDTLSFILKLKFNENEERFAIGQVFNNVINAESEPVSSHTDLINIGRIDRVKESTDIIDFFEEKEDNLDLLMHNADSVNQVALTILQSKITSFAKEVINTFSKVSYSTFDTSMEAMHALNHYAEVFGHIAADKIIRIYYSIKSEGGSDKE